MVDLETVTVRNDLEDLPAIYSVLERFCTGAGLSDAVRRTLCLVVEELFANTVAYGYPDGGKDQIAVTAALGPTHVKLVLSDRAKPFDNSAFRPVLRKRTQSRTWALAVWAFIWCTSWQMTWRPNGSETSTTPRSWCLAPRIDGHLAARRFPQKANSIMEKSSGRGALSWNVASQS